MSKQRPTHQATVVSNDDLCPSMRRLVLQVPDWDPGELAAEAYVKLVFEPVTRTYTIRAWDADAHHLTLDVLVHGDEGLGGPWVRNARPGDTIGIRGPGGHWVPGSADTDILLVGDEAAAPAIARALELAPEGARVRAYVEVADADHEIPLPATGAEITWVHRGGAVPGIALAHAVRAYAPPADHATFSAFVHGNADMIKDLRRWLFVELGIPRDRVSVSGYWRVGLTDEQWRAVKKEFTARMEADEISH